MLHILFWFFDLINCFAVNPSLENVIQHSRECHEFTQLPIHAPFQPKQEQNQKTSAIVS